jgi:hypothetical protein
MFTAGAVSQHSPSLSPSSSDGSKPDEDETSDESNHGREEKKTLNQLYRF